MREDVHIKEFGMWSYTESENSWLVANAEGEKPPIDDDTPVDLAL